MPLPAIALLILLTPAPALSGTPSYEDLIAKGAEHDSALEPVDATAAYREAFEAMPTDVKRQDLGEELASSLHFDASYAAWRATGDVKQLEAAKRMLEVVLAEQRAAVTAGSRALVSPTLEQKLAQLDKDIAFANREVPDPAPAPLVEPTPSPLRDNTVLPPPEPDRGTLAAPVALLSTGAVLGLAGLASIIGGEASRGFNRNRYEQLSAADRARNPNFLHDVNRTSTAVTIAGAVALAAGIALVVPGAVLYKRRSDHHGMAFTPVVSAREIGAQLRLRF